MKTNSNSKLNLDLDFNKYFMMSGDEDAEVKFSLFVQLRKIEQLNQALDKIALQSATEDQDWVLDHTEMLDDLLNELLDQAMLILDGVHLDKEGIDLSLRLMTDIRATLDRVHQLLYGSGFEN